MNESADPSQFEGELRELRARAYGPHPDIQEDPEALARLAELETAQLGRHASLGLDVDASQDSIRITPGAVVAIEAPMPGPTEASVESVRPMSFWQKVMATSTGRVWLIGSVVAIIAVVYAVTWFAPPKPEATLQPTDVEAGSLTFAALSQGPLHEVDRTTLRGYETYRGLEPWVAENAQGSRCLVLTEGSSLHGIRCAPPEAELMIDVGAYPLDYFAEYMEGLADGSVIRFQLHGDSVDAYLFAPPGAD